VVILTTTAPAAANPASEPGGSTASDGGPHTLNCDGEIYPVATQKIADMYNQNTDQVPSVITGLVASNTTEIRVENARQKYYTVKTNNDLNITDVSVGSADNPDIMVKLDKETVCDAYTSDDRVDTVTAAYEDGEITITATGTLDKAKVFIGKQAAGILDMF
jgi:hypothetical protein